MAYFKAGFLGFPGSGKTYTATQLAIGICKETKATSICYVDTETGSDFLIPLIHNAGLEAYQVKSRSFNDLLQSIKECEENKIGVLIVDSITHIWRDLTESYDRKLNRRGRLQFQDWAVIKKEWAQYTDAFINAKIHIIVCGRAGYEYDYDFNEDGTKDLIKTDIKMKVESEFGFEPSLVVMMERTSENKENVKEHLGKTDRKSKEAKQTHKPEAGSKWIHRAYVLKDRTDTINGQVFDYPKFTDFLPHFRALNIGGEHLGVDTSRVSDDRFDIEGRPKWQKDKTQKTIALEEIQGCMLKLWPSSGADDKKAKGDFVEAVFDTRSWTKVEESSLENLQWVVKHLPAFVEQYGPHVNIVDLWFDITSKKQDDVPL
jgi:hypothetical protein